MISGNGTVRTVAKKSDTDAVLEFVIGVILVIPIAAFFLLKWVFHGILWLIAAMAEKKKTAAGKEPVSPAKPGRKPGLLQKKRMESPMLETDDHGSDESEPWDEDIDDEEEDDFDSFEEEDEEEYDDFESVDESLIEEPCEDDQTQLAGFRDFTVGRDDSEMATIIGAGKYVFGEDLPMGKYDLKVVSGHGCLKIRYGSTEDDETWINMGKGTDDAKEYRNLSLEQGRYFMLEDSLRVEITRSRMLVIDP